MTGHGSTTANATAPKDVHGHGTPAELTAFYSPSFPRWVNHSMYWLSLGTMYFPLIGVIVGAFGVFWFSLAYYLFPGSTIIPAVIYSMATIRFTGAFHEDGLADMCDGFEHFEIMRDSANGTFAGLGLILFQLTKLGGVAYLIDTIELVPVVSTTLAHPNGPQLLAHVYKLAHLSGILISAHVLARWSCTYLLWRYKYVENASAAGKEFLLTVTTTRMIMATISTIVLVAAALFAVPSSQDYFVKQVAAWIISIYITVGMGRYVNRVIGGVIGDCLGAINQIVECSVYLAFGINWIRVLGDVADLYLMLKAFVDTFVKA
ncbi:hypothetical protein BCR33DRAFT_718783 [Rhizoclosmatium globosum]|uniref:Adenosylcobinamide-GDP ribazoletransferase n=1 Tax=Rhizoclosmatium globosum TaxID=329046 RepID=A0A1Y2C3M8_9FUNG|nr:hypothetical protein BCR33DRAFT_718783 [Rhizoclosmatium globosum]|eukprot:ORY41629.1 hypothetical protein BCR33DRAFT_718783 [Rhizoclosmatium globosum]